MPVSGIVVTCAPDNTDHVAQQLTGTQGVEVHAALPEGKIVAVLEADSFEDEMALVNRLQGLDGVVSLQLAYHNFEELSAEQP